MTPTAGAQPPTGRRVTVGLPVHNDPRGLRSSVPTVFGQSWQGDLRLVIVDDGSDDETPEVIDELCERYGRIEVIRNQVNRGRPRARNQLLEAAGDDLLAWIDSDDLWMPRKLERQLDVLAREAPEGTEAVLCATAFRFVFTDRSQQLVRVPAVDGDQLRNALTSTLYPYLWALIGPASAYREVGGFDERLSRRQDFEFLLRFLERGGRVVSTGSEPLCTYMKTDVGRDPREIEAANTIIEATHRPVLARYGRGFTVRLRRKHLLLAARFHSHNGARLASGVSRTRALLLAPLLVPTRPRELLSWAKGRYWALRRFAFRLRRRWRSTSRVLRTGGRRQAGRARSLIRRARSKLLRRPSAAPHLPVPLAEVDEWRRTLPTEQVLARTDRALRDVEPEAARSVWLGLDRAYQAEDRLWSASQVLDRALVDAPHDPELLVRSVELLRLQQEWEACVDRWQRLVAAQGQQRARPTTYCRISTSYQKLGRFEDSLQVCEAGLARFPDHPGIVTQLRRARAGMLRLRDHLAPTESDPAHGAAAGSITSFGFLEESGGSLHGELEAGRDLEAPVELLLNGEAVASTSASRSRDGTTGFSLNCSQLLEFLGDGDVLELLHDGDRVSFGELGTRVVVRDGFPSLSSEVVERVRRGHRFNKFGQLRGGNSVSRKRETLDLFEEVARLLDDRFGLTCVPLYGNLLGAVRAHDFLPHDVGGFDFGYLSAHREPDAVRAEVVDVALALIDAGFHVTVEPWSVMIRRKRGETVFVDLSYAWGGEDDRLGVSFGWRYEQVTDLDRFRSERWIVLADRRLRIPGNAEQLLHQFYGSGWLVPDQGFELTADLQRDERYLLHPEELRRLEAREPDRVRVRTHEDEDEG